MSIYTRFSFNDATLLKKWFCLISLWRKSSLEIISVNYICVRHKNRRKHNQHFKLLFFKINLHFGTSEYISTYGKLDLLPINSIFLVFPSRERQRRLMQTKVYYKLPLFSLQRSVSQTFKSSSCKNIFSRRVYHWYNLLQWIIFVPYDNCKQYLQKFILPRGLAQPPCCCALSNKCFERSLHFISIISAIILRRC